MHCLSMLLVSRRQFRQKLQNSTNSSMACDTHLAWKCLLTPVFRRVILTVEVGQTGFLVCDQGSLVGLHTKSLCAAVMICATLVNIQTQTDRQHFLQLIRITQQAELKIVPDAGLDSVVVSVDGQCAGGRGFESWRRKSDGHRWNL